MYYCFLSEDIKNLEGDPLTLQKEYAQKIGMLCIGDIAGHQILDESNRPINLAGHKVLLRSTYDNMIPGLRLLQNSGAELVETETDVEKIENWHNQKITHRRIWDIRLSDMEHGPLNGDLQEFLIKNRVVFLKSRRKGFSAVIKSSKILQRDSEVFFFLRNASAKYGVQMLLTSYHTLKTDSMGTRESRHVIMNGQVINSSRFVRAVKHTVPRSHIVKAGEIANKISDIEDFPKNYTLDLGEFLDSDEKVYIDIVELNPLSCSMCYVNNSIFDTVLPEIEEKQKQLFMGPEYCYDAIRNPQNYFMTRSSNRVYTYTSTERYSFL